MSGFPRQKSTSGSGWAGRSFAPSSTILLLRLTVSALLTLVTVVFAGCSVEQRQWVQPTFCEVHADCASAYVCFEQRCAADQDHDYLPDFIDICPTDPTNDHDRDGECDDVSACLQQGFDFDRDGICQRTDNCPHVANADQADRDGDGHGDVCDICPADSPNDTDGDGICDSDDSCPAGDCTTGSACAHVDDCIHGACSLGICAPLSMVRVESVGHGALWVGATDLNSVELARLGVVLGEAREPAEFVAGISWFQALWLANHLSEVLGMTPCYRLDDCSGAPESMCPAAMCSSTFECGQVAELPECTGLALPTLAEWLELAAHIDGSDAADTASSRNIPGCQDRSLVGGPHCAGVPPPRSPAPGTTVPAAGPLSEWVWHEHRMRFGRTRRLAMGANWRAPAVDFERLDSWAYRPQHQADYIGVRYVWRGGPE
jgi:hypothetical protein